jgi:uncharacterized protein
MMPSKNRVALVTGASSGLGAALAEELARRGYDLVLAARGVDAMTALPERIQKAHARNIIVQPADLSKPEGPGRLVDALDAADVRPSIVVNNAAIGLNERFPEQTRIDWPQCCNSTFSH